MILTFILQKKINLELNEKCNKLTSSTNTAIKQTELAIELLIIRNSFLNTGLCWHHLYTYTCACANWTLCSLWLTRKILTQNQFQQCNFRPVLLKYIENQFLNGIISWMQNLKLVSYYFQSPFLFHLTSSRPAAVFSYINRINRRVL